MLQQFLPEGKILLSEYNRTSCDNPASLRKAMEARQILEGVVRCCTAAHDLIVSVGPYTGVIPYLETALGIDSGRTRDIAILTRVGRPVAFLVTALEEEDGTLRPILSRRKAQQMAMEYFLSHLLPGTVLPVTVTHLEPFGVFVDIGCGLPSMIGMENSSVSRIRQPGERFTPGQEIYAIVTGTDPELQRVYLSHKELLGTWEQNVGQFEAGMTVPGYVRGVREYGIFVELTPNLSGLAEYREDVQEGERVTVYIKSILPEKMRIKLLILAKLPDAPPEPLHYFLPEGRMRLWRYAPLGCQKKGPETNFEGAY